MSDRARKKCCTNENVRLSFMAQRSARESAGPRARDRALIETIIDFPRLTLVAITPQRPGS